ncbi:MAG: sigma-70 family RNA polymerase sigma factor [bacterium]
MKTLYFDCFEGDHRMGGLHRRKSAYEFAALQYAGDGEPDGDRERMTAALKAIIREELTERQRVCLEMRYLKKMKVCDIASELGILPPTVCKHLKKARARIARVMRLSFPRLRGGGGNVQ